MENKVKFKKIIFKRGRPKKKISKRKKLRSQLDKLWSEIIRLRTGGRCECVTSKKRCEKKGEEGSGKTINAHHIFGRSNFRVRWDIRNGIALCAGHHTLTNWSAHKNPMWFIKMLTKLRGEKWYDDLMKEAMKDGMSIKLTEQDLERKKEELTKLLGELKSV